ncbi:MAG: hydantoinase/oxoprolinase family protein, partial [Acidimicrobiales bacterium]
RLPCLEIHTIGAGGGSIARVDPGGALTVGPRSAGAEPGPACYGLGGDEPTVTDANLVLGRIPAETRFAGMGALDTKAARAVLHRAGTVAEGVVAVADAAMAQAIRVVTVERGVDPRDLALVAFGGAGPLHACALAEVLGMAAVVVPPRAGVLSAVGLLCSPRQLDLVRSWADGTGRDLGAAVMQLAEQAREALRAASDGGEPAVETALDCRYRGQSHELTVPTPQAFEPEHRRRNGYARPGSPVEVVAIRARASLPPPCSLADLARISRGSGHAVTGPSVLSEPDCTVWVPEGWTAEVGGGDSWVIRRR